MDLLRLLALEPDRPIRIAKLLDHLWPGVSEAKGRASLRTAASQIRQSIRSDCIERRLDSLVLTGAWVDVDVFETLTMEARSFMRAGRPADVVAAAWAAESLYLADFTAYDDDSEWARETRFCLSDARRATLADASEAAVSLRWMRDAIDLATRAIEVDPCCERAHRSLMQAYEGMGEVEQALRVYEHCRRMLADEVGVDPSPQTIAVFQHVMAGRHEVTNQKSFVGQARELLHLSGVIEAAEAGSTALLCIRGSIGSGREALLEEATTRTGAELVRVDGVEALGKLAESGESSERIVALLPAMDDDSSTASTRALARALVQLRSRGNLLVAISGTAESCDEISSLLETSGVVVHTVDSPALPRHDLEELAGHVLSGAPAAQLINRLEEESRGLAGMAAATLRRWLDTGRIISTELGLELAPSVMSLDNRPEMGVDLRRVLAHLAPFEIEVAQIVAMLDGAARSHVIASLLDSGPWSASTTDDISIALDHLSDLGVICLHDRGYEFRNPCVRSAVLGWVRPSHRRRLHRRIAETGIGTLSSRAMHWKAAGEPRQACDALLQAALVSRLYDESGTAVAQLEEAISLATGLADVPAEVEVLHQVESLARASGYPSLADAASARALDVMQSGELPEPRSDTELVGPVADLAAADYLIESTSSETAPLQQGWGALLEQHLQQTIDSMTALPSPAVHVSLSIAITPEQLA